MCCLLHSSVIFLRDAKSVTHLISDLWRFYVVCMCFYSVPAGVRACVFELLFSFCAMTQNPICILRADGEKPFLFNFHLRVSGRFKLTLKNMLRSNYVPCMCEWCSNWCVMWRECTDQHVSFSSSSHHTRMHNLCMSEYLQNRCWSHCHLMTQRGKTKSSACRDHWSLSLTL